MNLFRHFRERVLGVVGDMAAEGRLPGDLSTGRITVEPPREAAHGDVTTNAAMVLAKPAGMKPRDLAGLLAERLGGLESVAGADIAGPGFINMRLEDAFWHARLAEILRAGPAYGDSAMGGGAAVNVEFVSANPTGPLHIGHGRGAVIGDALAALLGKAGYTVTREYYINDAGAQVEALARSLHLRYLVAVGEGNYATHEILKSSGDLHYGGDYLQPVAEDLALRDDKKWVEKPEAVWLEPLRGFAVEAMMGLIKADLEALGIRFDKFTSERDLVARGAVDDALTFLEDRDLVHTGVLEPPKGKVPDDWEPRPQVLFRATRFGDDVDRPLKKADGSWTYFATDIAYHLDKFRRGFKTMIDIWGADHGGYVKRVQAAVQAVTEGAGDLDVKVCRLVNLLDDGRPVKMSKRAGSFVTLRDVIDAVGKDVVRFIMLTRTNDKPLDFDLVRVTEQSRDNPVFYVQYAHARVCSVMRHAAEIFDAGALRAETLAEARLQRLTDPSELGLIKLMAGWPRLVEGAAETHEPHRVAFYLNDLAAQFHALW
ncbi:MAG: arginine--tRNA ligase, partial [Alphaproteobacteria bacterium]|nr:arginine--tRNA ligase [Alphaproteobacteria bacterium]